MFKTKEKFYKEKKRMQHYQEFCHDGILKPIDKSNEFFQRKGYKKLSMIFKHCLYHQFGILERNDLCNVFRI